MKFYNQPIILFGLLLPVLLAGAVIAACYMGADHLKTTLQERSEIQSEILRSRMGMRQIETVVAAEQENLERWKTQLAEEPAGIVPRYLRTIRQQLPDQEFQETSLDITGDSAGFGAVSAQKSSQIRIGARGTFRSLQRAFLELETRMPQLQLEELRLTPNPNQSALLNAQISYTAWEN